jgi:hypothetical protein
MYVLKPGSIDVPQRSQCMAATAASQWQVSLVGLDDFILILTIVVRLCGFGEIANDHYMVSYDHVQSCMATLIRRRFLHG